MGTLFRKLKAALGIGSIWGVVAGTLGAVAGGFSGWVGGSVAASILTFGGVAGAAGLVLGTGFGVMLSVMDGNRTLDEVTPNRSAVWGFVVGATGTALAGLAVIASGAIAAPTSVLIAALASGTVCYGALTGLLAAGTVWVAKRGSQERIAGPGTPDEGLLGTGES